MLILEVPCDLGNNVLASVIALHNRSVSVGTHFPATLSAWRHPRHFRPYDSPDGILCTIADAQLIAPCLADSRLPEALSEQPKLHPHGVVRNSVVYPEPLGLVRVIRRADTVFAVVARSGMRINDLFNMVQGGHR
jgi:hypothetical protein